MALLLVSEAQADISNAAVLYLRIAAGARAAGMGEAFVAIADDATATHWNPAGLGAYPLANSWIENKVPADLQPLTAIASVRQSGGNDYTAFEVWGLTAKGVARSDNKDWYLDETFSTTTDQTVADIARQYFNLTDEEQVAATAERVAQANNRKSEEYLDSLKTAILNTVSADYSERSSLEVYLDSLMAAYGQCRINWEKVEQVEEYLTDGSKDGEITEVEADRISIAVEKSRMRFIPEELKVPYSAIFEYEPKVITSVDRGVLFGGEGGLTFYNGRTWQTFKMEDGLPSNNILSLATIGEQAFIGTDSGLARFAGQRLGPVQGLDKLPKGPVMAIGAADLSNIWVVIDQDLYHYDGVTWSNCLAYTVLLDDTPESIAEKFAIFGSETEKQSMLNKMREVNRDLMLNGIALQANAGEVAVEDSTADENEDMISQVLAGTGLDTAMVAEDSVAVEEVAVEEIPADTAEVAAEVTTEEATVEEIPVGDFNIDDIEPGMIIRVPYTAGLIGKVNDIFAGRDQNVWIGSEYGLMVFNGSSWDLPGYRTYRIKEGDTFDDVVAAKRHTDVAAAETYARQIRDINMLDGDNLEVGQRIKIYRNPAACAITQICYGLKRLFFATDAGMIEYDAVYWSRSSIRNLAHTKSIGAVANGKELWLATPERVVTKASARSQFTFMHAKWLPELTDDVYYEFVSFVKGTENWGTFGGCVTFITYGEMLRTGQFGDTLDVFESFDVAFTGSYGVPLTQKLKVGLSAKIMYSKLSDIGTAYEKGKGTSTGFAVDFGMLYHWSPRLNLGMAFTNLGPSMSYIDASQSDPLPRNLAVGFAYKFLQSDWYQVLLTAEANKIMVGLDDGFSEEMKQVVFNFGAEMAYSDLVFLRGGYIYDQEGDVKTPTLGFGVRLINRFQFDFAYIPSTSGESAAALKNTLRSSFSLLL